MTKITLTTDSIQSTNDGFDYTSADEQVTIASGVLIESESAYAVNGNGQSNATLNNHGQVISGESDAVYFGIGDGHVTNSAGAEIYGYAFGIDMEGAGKQVVNNSGTIISATDDGIYFSENNTAVSLTNHGTIFGSSDGITNFSSYAGGTFDNFGTIRSLGDGIYLDTEPTLLSKVTNETGGVIKGAAYSIYATGELSLTNKGTIVGEIDCAYKATIVNDGTINGSVYLSNDNDTYSGTGHASGEVDGGGGNDHLTGGGLSDQLGGGDGNDTLEGGGGNDRFIFDTMPDTKTNHDSITDFTSGHDKIELLEAIFHEMGTVGEPLASKYFHNGASATTADQHILYTQGNGHLYYDDDGNGPDARVLFAVLTTEPTIQASDFVVEA